MASNKLKADRLAILIALTENRCTCRNLNEKCLKCRNTKLLSVEYRRISRELRLVNSISPEGNKDTDQYYEVDMVLFNKFLSVAQKNGIKHKTYWGRVRVYGWNVERAATEKLRRKVKC